MPQNATKKGLKEENPKNFPELVYKQLELSKQIACYQFWCHLNSAGKEGWDPGKTPGSIYHWRSSKYLQDNIKPSGTTPIESNQQTALNSIILDKLLVDHK